MVRQKVESSAKRYRGYPDTESTVISNSEGSQYVESDQWHLEETTGDKISQEMLLEQLLGRCNSLTTPPGQLPPPVEQNTYTKKQKMDKKQYVKNMNTERYIFLV